MSSTNDHGDPIFFKHGKYEGSTGFYDKVKGTTKHYVYVIIDEGDRKFNYTKVKKGSVVKKDESCVPGNYAEITFDQHPDHKVLVEKLCKGMAECRIN